ncbi:MAG TPA: hypothetical protein VN495_03030 [Candidatus Paceibacterota bacterium]|nr:hypothetical protein [Candidatus Paceibacterota bacterium]
MAFIMTILAVVSALAVALAVPLNYAVTLDLSGVSPDVVMFVTNIEYIVYPYIITNSLSGVGRTNAFLFHADTIVSWVALASLNLTLGYVVFEAIREIINTGQDARAILHLLMRPGVAVNLVAPALFSWLDVTWIHAQKKKKPTNVSHSETIVIPPEVAGQSPVVVHCVFPWASDSAEHVLETMRRERVPFMTVQRG